MNFECHITIQIKDHEIGEQVAAKFHWKTSQIDGDPILGAKPFFYLTTHDNDYVKIFNRMKNATDELKFQDVRVIREKIELIMYDKKSDY